MILINGYFYCRRLTGIERYAYEITKRLDKLSLPGEIALIVPGDCNAVPEFENITLIRHKKTIPHILWQLFYLQLFLLQHPGYTILDFGNTCLPLFPGIVFLHDIYCEFFPEDFTGFRDKIVRIYNRWQYRLIAGKAKKICTVSCFTRDQIIRFFRVSPEKINVIYSSWNHFLTIESDYSVFSEFPLAADEFYFSLGSLSKRKNLKWLVNYAAAHPGDVFAVSGDVLPTASGSVTDNIPENIILLGYLDDSKVKALMEKCRAFILPSYYEGFGLTPLEALSCGAQIIVANAASLPEIYGNTAHYIDPYDTNTNLDELLRKPVEPPEQILRKYSYDNAAEKVLALIREK